MNICPICRRPHQQNSLTFARCNNKYRPRINEDPSLIFLKATFENLTQAGSNLYIAGTYPSIEKHIIQALSELTHEILLL